MDLPIEIERATWSGRGQLDWWVKERQEWWGRVRGAVGFPHGSRSRRRPGARRRVHHRVSVGGCEVWTYDLGMTATPDDGEDVLAGGDMTAVVRIGDTVRRTAGPWTPTVHAFMRHLRASGFADPEPLGIDERGREIISLLPGAPASYPLPDFAWSDATLTAVAQALRRFHDASVGFTAPADGRWQWPAHTPTQVICHNDFAPYNLMFQDGGSPA